MFSSVQQKIFICLGAVLLSTHVLAQNYDYSNKNIQKIIDFQDHRQADSLAKFLQSNQPQLQLRAILAFGSLQQPTSMSVLIPFLSHADGEIRKATAFSLGQLANKEAAPSLLQQIRQEQDDTVLAVLLEALGKCATPEALAYLSDYQCSREPNCIGQAKGLYRAIVWQRQSSAALTQKAIELLTNQSVDARLFAANALARNPQRSYDSVQVARLLRQIEIEQDEFVRMNTVAALNSTLQMVVEEKLLQIAKKDNSELVRINAIRALAKFDTARIQQKMIGLLYDPHPLVTLVASEHLRGHAKKNDRIDYLELAESTDQPQARANLLAVAIRSEDKEKVTKLVKGYFKKTRSSYEQGFLLNALAEKIENFDFIIEKIDLKVKYPLNTFAFEALMGLLNHTNFQNAPQRVEIEEKVFSLLTRIFTEGKDVVLMGLAAAELRNPQRNYRAKVKSIDFLKNALLHLPLPLEIEAYLDIQKTIQFFEGSIDPPPTTLAFNHPVDLGQLQQLIPSQLVSLKTTKGSITIELLTDVAPASVLNFLDLVNQGYFEQKIWHRVVPNFVIQSGCPRGDGYGNVDFSIRSEFMPIGYGEGYVGMASAGKDTEGSQFFITHSPTPHLDGRYTIFGRVVKGMDVVRQITVGDKIEKAKLVK